MSFIGVMKDKTRAENRRNVLHPDHERQTTVPESIKCPSAQQSGPTLFNMIIIPLMQTYICLQGGIFYAKIPHLKTAGTLADAVRAFAFHRIFYGYHYYQHCHY